ncbi:MAG: hypothetical protein OS112_03925 [Methanoregula sp.]|nr:MAG: hypothetical protein OS112_03925 [Methanoregula sp.]
MLEVTGEKQGLITMVYDYGNGGHRPAFINIQHEFKGIIRASFQSEMTDNRCLDVILLRGYQTQFKSLEDRLLSEKGVESVELKTL